MKSMKKVSTTRRLAAGAALALILALIPALAGCATSPEAGAPAVGPAGFWEGTSYVRTMYGTVAGRQDSGGTIAWKGIPYAAPPVGPLRWKAPRDPQPWEGVRPSCCFLSKSIQPKSARGGTKGSEDSLYLNIWRPFSQAKGLPVFVWIHGGGNSSGSADGLPDYNGSAMASKSGVLFVSLNYRLGVLGWLSHPALRDGLDPKDDSGNFGTLDIIKALEWVRDNIAAFGGDPGNVTIAGESAGGFNVLSLLTAPGAKGLFHRAVAESGYRFSHTREEADAFAQDYVRRLAAIELGLPGAKDTAKALPAAAGARADAFIAGKSREALAQWMRSLDPARLVNACPIGQAGLLAFPYPVNDGVVLPVDGFDALSDPARVNAVPLIVGTNKEETKLFLALARKDSRDPMYQPLAELGSAMWKADGADSVADALASGPGRPPVYVYRFDWGAPDASGKSVQGGRAGKSLGAFHGLDISFFLGTESMLSGMFYLRVFTMGNLAGRTELQADMGTYLANFIRTGNPNGPGNARLPAWTPWDSGASSPAFLVFDADLDHSRIHQEFGRVTTQSVMRRLETEYPEPLRSRLRDELDKGLLP